MNQQVSNREKLKRQIISFVEETQKPTPNPVSFSEFSRSNPDRKSLLNKQEALKIAVELIRDKKLENIDHNSSFPLFKPNKFTEEEALVIQEYPRFLARIEVLGAAFTQEGQTTLGKIDSEAISQIDAKIETLSHIKKQEFGTEFNKHLVLFPFNLPERRKTKNFGLN